MAGEDVWARYAAVNLPRYTSYPTAPHFHAGIAAPAYREWLAALRAERPVSLYLHVPFCRAMCWYCGCHTTISQRQEPIDRYLAALHREIEVVAAIPRERLPVAHVHFGGGTPTIVGPDGFRDLIRALRTQFHFDAATEIAVEVDPRTLSAEVAEAMGEAGVRRASMGVQTFDPAVQRAINRIQSVEQTERTVSLLRGAGVRGINMDLIYGLPLETVDSCIETVRRCVAMGPDRFAVFGYAHVPTFKKHQAVISERDLPDARGRRMQAEAIGDALVAAGYVRIGFDHFARPADPMAQALASGRLHRNFQGYTTDGCDTLLAFGASAIGRLPLGYVQNEVALGRYCERVADHGLATVKGYRLSADDLLRADLIERVMCDSEVDVAAVCARHGASLAILADAGPRLRALADDGLVAIDGSVLRVPEPYRLLSRTVASVFDAHLAAPARTYSRAV
ncbi:MAG: oxygen-independent coproporphyrinogen III oxidase [Variibacter sp.]|nr:oxygen-independent coproporphyrinogen III oxidase [Variibacter sp.]